ncbi:hypothetical protein N7532_001944 [Penicillium argentinense]|uniref:Uncharacterized protein n=1 Tax=Penicillium argentinense TaxID=1131581 RepID=A0A9W9G3H3_9EURO|nr:uncharacterized protein N7532_001944 [Penicillium argentinense]KAJ5111409.1 hypothetical protein N7532_001944 [Penicillium argentinense]
MAQSTATSFDLDGVDIFTTRRTMQRTNSPIERTLIEKGPAEYQEPEHTDRATEQATKLARRGRPKRARSAVSSIATGPPPRTRRRYQLRTEDHVRMRASEPVAIGWE